MPGEHDPCPCGSGRGFGTCCGPWLAGAAAPTAAELMRSRYTAYVLGDEAYLLATWHPDTRPAAVDSAAGPAWCGLAITAVEAGGAGDGEGWVSFEARYRAGGRAGALRERSRFLREAGRWWYVDGVAVPAAPARNAPCPCGSGRKYKRCCGA